MTNTSLAITLTDAELAWIQRECIDTGHYASVADYLLALIRRDMMQDDAPAMRNGIALLPVSVGTDPISPELVRRLRDELP